MKILNKSKYDGYVFTCPHCELDVELENEDLSKLIYRVYPYWYEDNVPSWDRHEVFIRCNCGSLIPIETAQGSSYRKHIAICGTKKELKENNLC